eukprot:TRINITY_DN27974_c0_g1_i1.p1 TRINITY_DN27974_c0_g1~~TRINITY_DN27974_c0_g1_i1.p1  ORF type:complete len:191 (+),score=46.86 TRINITY_DN27974_c0_g1_i1:135-707(+)
MENPKFGFGPSRNHFRAFVSHEQREQKGKEKKKGREREKERKRRRRPGKKRRKSKKKEEEKEEEEAGKRGGKEEEKECNSTGWSQVVTPTEMAGLAAAASPGKPHLRLLSSFFVSSFFFSHAASYVCNVSCMQIFFVPCYSSHFSPSFFSPTVTNDRHEVPIWPIYRSDCCFDIIYANMDRYFAFFSSQS